MENNKPRPRLRGLLEARRAVPMASVFDPISARFAQELAFEAALMGGSLASHVVLGAPDLIVLTLSELAEQVSRCTRASSVPLVIDGDHGYGNALSVMRTITELDRAGAAAVMIEDTLLPRPYGVTDAPALLPLDESVGKIAAAVKARGDSDMLVFGRTGAAAITSVEDAIVRFRAYENVGVDALFLPGVPSREALDRIVAAVRLPVVLGGATAPLRDPQYLASRGISLWSDGHQTFSVMVQALYDAMKTVREGSPAYELAGTASRQVMDQATGAAAYAAWTQDFLGARQD